MKFKYLSDPLFLCCVALYLLNRMVLKVVFRVEFFHCYLNDVICVPFLVPPMLFAARILRMRSHDQRPLTHEIFVPMIVWALMYEIVLPESANWREHVVSDPYDVLSYATGACIASYVWDTVYPDETNVDSVSDLQTLPGTDARDSFET